MKHYSGRSSNQGSPLRSSIIRERDNTRNLSDMNQHRLLKLAERLEYIKGAQDTEKSGKVIILEEKFKAIESFVDDHQEEFSRKLRSIGDSAVGVHKKLEEELDEFEGVIESNIRDIDTLEEKLAALYDIERQKRKETELKIEALFNERFNHLRSELSKENEEMSNSIAKLTQAYETDVEKIKTSLSEEILAREEADNKTVSDITDEIKKIDDSVAELKSAHETNELRVLTQLKEASIKMKLTIDDQSKVREMSHAKMIDLLEEACRTLEEIESKNGF